MNQVAETFISALLGKPLTAKYGYSVYNCTTKSELSRVFEVEDGDTTYLVKVGLDGAVLELYKTGYQDYDWVAVDKANPDNILEVYKMDPDGKRITKYDLDNNVLAVTHLGSFGDMPDAIQRTVFMSFFKLRGSIWAWSEKAYGLIVEYKE